MIHKRFWLIGVFLLVLSLPSLTAISLSGKTLGVIIYRPGLTIINHYVVGGTDYPIEVLPDNLIFKNITISEIKNNEFDLIINFPASEHPPPGEQIFGLTVREKPDTKEGGGINTLVAVSKNIRVQVYSYEKDITTSLDIPNVNQGSNLSVDLGIASVGYPDIEAVQGKITLYDKNKKELSVAITPSKPLKGLEAVNFHEQFITQALPADDYFATAVVTYDGKQKSINTTFLIGNMDILVKDYTKEVEEGFAEFSVKVESRWGSLLRNVHAKVFIKDQELLETPSIDLPAWQKGELKGIMKVDFPPGQYDGKLKLFFEGESKEVPIYVLVKKSSQAKEQEQALAGEAGKETAGENQSSFLWIVGIAVVLIILGIAVTFFVLKIRKKNRENIGGGNQNEL